MGYLNYQPMELWLCYYNFGSRGCAIWYCPLLVGTRFRVNNKPDIWYLAHPFIESKTRVVTCHTICAVRSILYQEWGTLVLPVCGGLGGSILIGNHPCCPSLCPNSTWLIFGLICLSSTNAACGWIYFALAAGSWWQNPMLWCYLFALEVGVTSGPLWSTLFSLGLPSKSLQRGLLSQRTAEDISFLKIWGMLGTAQLFGGSGESLDI